ncbi:hypothetical protein KB221_07420 [Aquidulcibacter paucihalophilus]|nr:hypothetical protein KB221_07420 [Aquidulcibacter paucihalophilus]
MQLTDFELAIAQELAKPRETELLICLNSDGTVEVDRVEGATDRAELTDLMRVAMASEGVRLWHNHPSRGSLSSADWRLAVANVGIRSIAAVNDSGTVFLGSVKDRSRLDPSLFDDAAGMGEHPLTLPIITKDSFNDMVHMTFLASHLANQQACDDGMICYAAALSDYDQSLWDTAQAEGRTGMAAQAIREHFQRARSCVRDQI